jgi:aquaporin Z
MTMMFFFTVTGSTRGQALASFPPLAIGLALVMVRLVSIPVTSTSVDPARSTGLRCLSADGLFSNFGYSGYPP